MISSGPKGAEVEIYKVDCTSSLNDDEIVSLSSEPAVYLSDNITYGLFVDENKLGSSEIVSFDDGTNSSGVIAFCTSLKTKASDGLVVVNKKVQYNIAFDLTNVEFSIKNIGVQGDEPEEVDLNVQFAATACECDEFFSCISNTYTQGATAPVLRVCITPSSNDLSVKNMNLKLTNGLVSHDSVTYGSDGPEFDGVTTINTLGHKTMVVTRIIEKLFVENGSSTISASGTLLLTLGSGANKEVSTGMYSYSVSIEIDRDEEEGPNGCSQNLLRMFKKNMELFKVKEFFSQ